MLLLAAACGELPKPEQPPEVERIKMVADCMQVLRAFGKAFLEKDNEAIERLSDRNYHAGAGWGISGPFEKKNEDVTKFFSYPGAQRLRDALIESDPTRVTYHDRGCKIRLEREGTTFTFNMWRRDESGYFVRMIGTE